jgi:hypothetical protein
MVAVLNVKLRRQIDFDCEQHIFHLLLPKQPTGFPFSITISFRVT